MDIVSAAQRMLAQNADVTEKLGYDDAFETWLFQEKLYAKVEGTGRLSSLGSQAVAVLLSQRGNWTSPNEHNTARFPRLMTEFYADPDRDDDGHVTDPLTAKDKILAAHEAIDRYLHATHSVAQWWPDRAGVLVLRSRRLGELEFFQVPDGDGMMRAQIFYAVGIVYDSAPRVLPVLQ